MTAKPLNPTASAGVALPEARPGSTGNPLTLDGAASGDRMLPNDAPEKPDAQALQTRALVTGSVVALIILGLLWELWLAPTGSGTLAIKVLPLFLPLLGLWRFRLYTYRWLSLLVWVYAGEGLLRATTESGLSMGLAALEVLLSMVIFVGCVMHVRGRLKHKMEAAPAAQA